MIMADMNFKKSRRFGTRMLVFLALMIAFNVVFTRLLAVNLLPGGTLRLGLTFLPIVITSIIYGPYIGALGAAVADMVGMLVLPTGGAYFFGFTLSQALFGFTYGIFFKNKEITLSRLLFGFSIPGIAVGIFLKSIWFMMIMNESYAKYIIPNALNVLALLPIQIAVTYAMKNYIKKMQASLALNRTGNFA